MNFQYLKNRLWHLPKSIFFNLIYFFPTKKLTLIGVTGTDGKTTTCTLLNQILLNAGYKSDLITTINSPGLHTTSPDPQKLQSLFRSQIKKGITHVVCEVTSHALDQNRFWGCQFEVSVITNTSHEHLDYHHSMTNYTLSKAKLFSQSKISILNQDDESYPIIKKTLPITTTLKTYGTGSKNNYRIKQVKLDSQQLEFSVNDCHLITDSNYSYQVQNITAAFAVADSLGISPKIVADTILHFPETKGRREEINNDLDIRTIVDFAHTPNALKATLESLRLSTRNRLIVIFGATGGRDKTKRPVMGQVASELADIAIITADDTRHEKIENINQDIISGIDQDRLQKKQFEYFNIPNRQDAFNQAIKLAKPGDTIVACGKGHETTILHGSTEFPWSESEAFRTAFRHRQTS